MQLNVIPQDIITPLALQEIIKIHVNIHKRVGGGGGVIKIVPRLSKNTATLNFI